MHWLKREEIAWELRHEDAANGVYNKYNTYSVHSKCRDFDVKPSIKAGDQWDTFDGWKKRGYWIMKGARSGARDSQGKPLFHISMVKE